MNKDDLFGEVHPAPRTLWIEREGMLEARDNWYAAYLQTIEPFENENDRHLWNVSWAAAIAAAAYILEGRKGPRA